MAQTSNPNLCEELEMLVFHGSEFFHSQMRDLLSVIISQDIHLLLIVNNLLRSRGKSTRDEVVSYEMLIRSL